VVAANSDRANAHLRPRRSRFIFRLDRSRRRAAVILLSSLRSLGIMTRGNPFVVATQFSASRAIGFSLSLENCGNCGSNIGSIDPIGMSRSPIH
jgi:hypothetical protein